MRPNQEEKLKLWLRIKQKLGYEIPRIRVCGEHDTPFDFVSDNFFEEVTESVVLANRSGGKTLNTAILNYLDMTAKAAPIVVVAGSLGQAQRGYDYSKSFWNEKNAHLLDGEPLMKLTRMRNGGSLEILAGSERSVHAPHVPKLRMDEIELMKKEVYTGALSIPISQKDVKSQIVKTSTRFRLYGMMNQVLEAAAKNRTPTYKWCVWEVSEKCSKQSCLGCILADDCQGKAKRAEGYMAISDIEQKIKELDRETWEAQWLCLKPSRTGLVYKEANEDIHIVDMTPKGEEYGAIDWGYAENHPFVYLKLTVAADGTVFVDDELYLTGMPTTDIIPICKKRFNPKEAHADPSGATEIAEFKKAGFVMIAKAQKVEEGIPIVRSLLKPSGDRRPQLFVNRRCVNFIKEFFTLYHYKEESDQVEKDDDHGPDALRYFVKNRYARATGFIDYAKEAADESKGEGAEQAIFRRNLEGGRFTPLGTP